MAVIYKNKEHRFCLKHLYGNCLERVGVKIPNRGHAVVDQFTDLRVGDIVICTKISGQIPPMCKQVKAIDGETVVVGTAYLDRTKDYEFEAEEILGVVKEIYAEFAGYQVYSRPRALKRAAIQED